YEVTASVTKFVCKGPMFPGIRHSRMCSGHTPLWPRCQNRIGIILQTSPGLSSTFVFIEPLTGRKPTGLTEVKSIKWRRPGTQSRSDQHKEGKKTYATMKLSRGEASPLC